MKSKFFFGFTFLLLALFVLMYNASNPSHTNKSLQSLNALSKLPRLSFSTSYLEEKRLSPQANKLQKMDFVYAR